jgi:adenylate cyclase
VDVIPYRNLWSLINPWRTIFIAEWVWRRITGRGASQLWSYPERLDRPSRLTSSAKDFPPLPAKPSIAVLPFENLSGDREQEYFADGMVEEIITALSRIRWLFVISRNSSFS